MASPTSNVAAENGTVDAIDCSSPLGFLQLFFNTEPAEVKRLIFDSDAGASNANTGDDGATDSGGNISEDLSFFCEYDRCMPIAEVQWYFEIDVDERAAAGSDNHTDFENSNTFQVLRDSADYTVSAYGNHNSGDLTVAAVDGANPTGNLGSEFGAVSTVDSGTVTLPVNDQRVKRVYTSARWSGSSTLLDTHYGSTNWSKAYFW